MSQYADGGVMATKPYAGGGAYIDRMSDYCSGVPLRPEEAGGRRRLPVHRGLLVVPRPQPRDLQGNQRIARAMTGLGRLKDLPALVEQEEQRGSRAP